MRIRWEVEDGYAGKARPHYIEVPDEELEELSEDEQNAVIDEHVDDAFGQIVSFSWKRTN